MRQARLPRRVDVPRIQLDCKPPRHAHARLLIQLLQPPPQPQNAGRWDTHPLNDALERRRVAGHTFQGDLLLRGHFPSPFSCQFAPEVSFRLLRRPRRWAIYQAESQEQLRLGSNDRVHLFVAAAVAPEPLVVWDDQHSQDSDPPRKTSALWDNIDHTSKGVDTPIEDHILVAPLFQEKGSTHMPRGWGDTWLVVTG